jgi:hypothetical protein
MQSFHGYAENGRIVPIGDPELPDGCKVIITVLDVPAADASVAARIERKLKVINDLEEGLKGCEPLPAEFDEILSQRVRPNSEA